MIGHATRNLEHILLQLIVVKETEKITPRLTTSIHMHTFIEGVINKLFWDNSEITPHFSVEIPDDFHLRTDTQLMEYLFYQIIHNSIHFKKAGTIPSIKITLSENADYYIFTITDNGIGIPKEIQEKVFDKFYRGTTASKSVGMGLYIVKEILEKMNAKYTLESSHEGTSIALFFSKEAAKTLHLTERQEEKTGQKSERS